MAEVDPVRHERDEFPRQVREDVLEENRKCSPAPGCYWCEWCLFCNPDRRLFHVDHMLAAVHGGLGTPDNAIVLCGGCNLSKRDRNEPGFGAYAYREKFQNFAPRHLREEPIPENERLRLVRARRKENAFVFPSVLTRFQRPRREGGPKS